MKPVRTIRNTLKKYRTWQKSKPGCIKMYVELLKRSKDFMGRLSDLKCRNAHHKPSFIEMKIPIGDKIYFYPKEPPENEQLLVKLNAWTYFCNNFGIAPSWMGNLKNLPDFIKLVHIGDIDISRVEVNRTKAKAHCPLLPIWVTPWTNYIDIKKYWNEVNKWQKSQGEYFDTARSNFYRDLAWYDLSKLAKLDVRNIAHLWGKNFPKDIENIKSRKSVVTDNQGTQNDDLQPLKNYPQKREDIRDACKHYCHSKRPEGQFGSRRFHDMVKKAIQRIAKLIRRINDPFLFYKGDTCVVELSAQGEKVLYQPPPKQVKL